MIDRVFVYGTLKRGGANHRLVAPYLRAVAAGRIPGALVDLGDYPGWVDGAGEVAGEVLRLERVDEALRVFDALEDYRGPGDPANLYERVAVTVATDAGPVRAWAYRYLGSVAGRPRVSGGAWPVGRKG